jgi:hypothetical protein
VTALFSTALIVVFNGNGVVFHEEKALIVAFYSNGGVLHEGEALIVAFYSNGGVFDQMATRNPLIELVLHMKQLFKPLQRFYSNHTSLLRP